MENLLEKIKKASGRLQDCIKRFPFSFAILCLITVASAYMIITDEDLSKLTVSLIMAGMFCFLMELSLEYEIHRIRYLVPAVSILTGLLVFFLLKKYENEYIYTALAGIGVAVLSLAAYVLYKDRENRYLFSYLAKSAFIVWIFTAVILAGFSVCIAAFHFLIFHFDEIWKIYSILFLLVLGLFGITLFLSYVPRPNEEVSVPSIYRTIIHKALFYIYLILIGILYLYIFKIIITWQMPVGKLNWFGCFALLFYVIFYLSVDETDGKVQALFKTKGAYLLVPVLAIQLFAIVIRLNAYGLTTARFMSLILIAIAVGYMLSAIFHFHVSRCFLFIALISLLFSCTPLNIYDVPNKLQENRLKNALSKGGALVNGVLNENVVMEAEYLEDAKSAYDYLRYSDGTKSSFFETFKESKIAKSFSDYSYEEKNIRSFYYSIDLEGRDFDISHYSVLHLLSYRDQIGYNDELKDFFLSLEQEKESEYEEDLLEYEFNDGSKIVFRYIDYDYDLNSGSFDHLYWEGMLLK
ncbi:MAG: DUF4153 domain-containing protein [Erysipelotrichaceae bacterium]|nr:DUF4153 domain-containing protein [Erysipelotrichaceae bacterium]